MKLVATGSRWLVSAGALAAAFVGAVKAYQVITHSERTFASFGWLMVAAIAIESLMVLAILRAEESRLARELRTARSGTSALRGMVTRRRRQQPFLMRIFSTPLGTAAVLLADGDHDGALEVLSTSSVFMQGGRLAELRAIVDADLDRASSTSVGLERCVQALRAMQPIGNREADRYRTHVLVKAVLEQGHAETAMELADDFARSDDEEQRLYEAWLRAWFDLDAEPREDGSAWAPLPDGELRMAALLARSQGAADLVKKLDARIAAVAPAEPRQ